MDIESMKMKLAELSEAIEKSVPGYVNILATIHKELQNQPELLYMLKDEDIALLITGLSTLHKVEITDPKDKKPISKQKGAQLSEDSV